MKSILTGSPFWGLGLADGTRTVFSLESPVNDNAFSGRVKSVPNRSLSGNQFGTLICALVAAYISDTPLFLASFLGEFVFATQTSANRLCSGSRLGGVARTTYIHARH